MRRILNKLAPLLIILMLCSCGSKAEKKEYRIGVDPLWYPLQLMGQEKYVMGFSTDLLTEIGQMQKLHLTLVRLDWDNLFFELQAGNVDAVLNSMPPYLFNELQYDFSDLYLATGPVLVVRVDDDIEDMEDLDGLEVAILEAGNAPLILQDSPDAILRNYSNTAKALQDLATNRIDAAFVDVLIAESYCRDIYNGYLKVVTPPLTDAGIRLITRDGENKYLISSFDHGLDKLQSQNRYKSLMQKWSLAP